MCRPKRLGPKAFISLPIMVVAIIAVISAVAIIYTSVTSAATSATPVSLDRDTVLPLLLSHRCDVKATLLQRGVNWPTDTTLKRSTSNRRARLPPEDEQVYLLTIGYARRRRIITRPIAQLQLVECSVFCMYITRPRAQLHVVECSVSCR